MAPRHVAADEIRSRQSADQPSGKSGPVYMARKHKAIEVGSGDVFVDLGFADAGERKLRVQLAMQVNELIARRRLRQAKAAALLGIPQPHVSALKHYKLSRFSSERLLRFLTLLDRDVEIVIRPKAKGRAPGLVSVSVV
jgi:predicted XRE-type DNA-binding protein